ncbi:CRISPR system precrRNA processing endoribonuclease RAMP protein Cas6 [Rhodococcus sp. YH1]|uniref:CRISPR system precrRNA processing endoribonuclease RAMP protein Cas6 n=1 Tax=Rhodococcus sp. YH1 TaxID=89066 RepID=UPI001387261C
MQVGTAPGTGSLTMSVVWLTDRYSWPRHPHHRRGQCFEVAKGPKLECTPVGEIVEHSQVEWIRRAHSGRVMPAESLRVRSVTPWAWSDPAEVVFEPGLVTERLARRWNDMLSWTPVSGVRRDPGRWAVPATVKQELRRCTIATSIRQVLPSGDEQVAYKNGAAHTRPTSTVDVVLQCMSASAAAVVWFEALWRFATWSGVGVDTTGGLGQVEVQALDHQA